MFNQSALTILRFRPVEVIPSRFNYSAFEGGFTQAITPAVHLREVLLNCPCQLMTKMFA